MPGMAGVTTGYFMRWVLPMRVPAADIAREVFMTDKLETVQTGLDRVLRRLDEPAAQDDLERERNPLLS